MKPWLMLLYYAVRTFVLLLVALFFFCGSASSVSTVAISPTLDGKRVVVCALTLQLRLNCSTLPHGSAPIQIRSGRTTYSGVVGGRGFVCAVRSPPGDPSVSIMGCWRFSGASSSAPEFKRIYRGSALSDLSAGSSHVCGIGKQSKLIQCWQWKGVRSPFVALQQPKFSDVSVGDAFVCGLTQSGNILCNGNDTNVTGRGGTYQSLEAGPTYACAITADRNQLSCWGSKAAPANEVPRDDEFTSLALGDNRACALRRNQSVACWGAQSLSVPATDAKFLAIKARGSVFCGVLVSNLSLLCWGSETETSLVFDSVLPGACSSSDSCQCGALPLLPNPCGSGGSVCQICPPIATGASLPAAAPQPESRSTNRSHPWSSKMVAFLVVGIVGCVSLAESMVFWYLGIRRGNSGSSRVHDSGRLDDEVEVEAEAEAGARNSEVDDLEEGDRRRRTPTIQKRLSHKVSMGSIEEFPLQVLLQATNNFSPDLLIGNGSYGSVYKAELEDGRRIAVKRAEASSLVGGTTRKNMETDTAFLAELGFLSKLNHKNLVRLLGFYEDNKERVLVYEYMSNGTLHDHLHKLNNASSPLATWPGRLKVALDAARGIEYLHVYAVPPVIHRDIKPSNILLDDTWTAKVSDFGLSLMGPTEEETHLSLLAAGTLGYIDPEYYRCHQLTTKSDIYSLGVVLLELLTGLKAIHLNENGLPRNVVDFVIPYIDRYEIHRVLDRKMPPPTPIEIEALARVGNLAAECVSLRSRDRPSVTDIVSDLDGAWREAACTPTFFSSSANSSQAAD